MSDIKTLVKEYSEITGRPAATLSVAEFLELKRFAWNDAAQTDERDNLKFISEQTNGKSRVSDEKNIIERIVAPTEKKKEENKKKEPTSSAFMMMRSVSG